MSCEIIEYYPICIVRSKGAKLNFRFLSNRYIVSQSNRNNIIENLYIYKFYLCIISLSN